MIKVEIPKKAKKRKIIETSVDRKTLSPFKEFVCQKPNTDFITVEQLMDNDFRVLRNEEENISERNLRKRKGVIVKMENNDREQQELEMPLNKMNPLQREFFLLYNSPDFIEPRLKIRTYLNKVASYLALLDDNQLKDLGNITEKVEEDSFTFGHFAFKDRTSYLSIYSKSNSICNSKGFIECTKTLANFLIKDIDFARNKCVNEVMNIANDSTTQTSDKINAYKLLGNWLGIDKPVISNNIDITLRGIDSALSIENIEDDNIEGDNIEGDK